jgi:DNA-directed RNA polymerase specialized sigma24 family protein
MMVRWGTGMKNIDIAKIHAHKFSVNTTMDPDDLLQEALMAVWYAESGGSYDPEKASLRTYSSTCAFRHLCTVVEQHKRRYPAMDELDEAMPSDEPTPEDAALFLELIRELPSDARIVVETVLSDAIALSGLSPTRAKRTIAAKLSWSRERIREAMDTVADLFRPQDDLDLILGSAFAAVRWAPASQPQLRKRVRYRRQM